MGRISLAFRAFFGTLFSPTHAERVAWAFGNEPLPNLNLIQPSQKTETSQKKESSTVPPQPTKSPPSKPERSEAVTLLEALQREARLIDLCQESLDGYSDEQIGAAARNVIRDSAKVLERFFSLRPASNESEGSTLEVPPGFDPSHYRLTGNISGQLPYRGKVVHTGWRATKCDLPQWSGGKAAAMIVAPIEVEVA